MTSDWIEIKKDPAHINREREKARRLRKSSWWKTQLANGECYYCKGHFDADELTMDHILPVVRGGKSVRGNVVPCCKDCNNKKKYLTPAELIIRELEEKERAAQEHDSEQP